MINLTGLINGYMQTSIFNQWRDHWDVVSGFKRDLVSQILRPGALHPRTSIRPSHKATGGRKLNRTMVQSIKGAGYS